MKAFLIYLLLLSSVQAADGYVFKVRALKNSDLRGMPKGANRPPREGLSQALKKCLSVITVTYRTKAFSTRFKQGELIINNDLVDDLRRVFKKFYEEPSFYFTSIKPVRLFSWDDNKSMRANNTSAFNYRYIGGTKRLSLHAKGMAIDINPRLNPYVSRRGKLSPTNASLDPKRSGTLMAGSRAYYLVEYFKELGWVWGGDWKSIKDYQHFEKRLDLAAGVFCKRPY